VPLLGAISRVYVAVPPRLTVCDAPTPLPVVGVLTAKSNTNSVRALLVDAAKSVSPLYVAVIECEPTAREEVVSAATPPINVPWPIGVVPSRKLTLPVGAPAVMETVAVKVVELVVRTGFTLLVKLTADAVWPMTSVPVAVPE
jgi:hypothetical protein